MATIKNLDKGGIIVRLSSKAIGYIWGCDDIENQEYIKYYIGGNKFTEEYTINPPFTINSNYLEIKIPYDTIKYITSDFEIREVGVYFITEGDCSPEIYIDINDFLDKGGWYCTNYLPDGDPIVEPSPKGDGIRVFYFRSSNCAPCKTMENNGTLDDFKSKYPNMKFTQISTEVPANKNLITYFNVTTMPTFVYAYKVGNYTYYDSITGAQTTDQLSNTLETIVEKGVDTSYIFDINDLTYYAYIKYNNASSLKDYGVDWEQIMAYYIGIEEGPELKLFPTSSSSYTSFKPTGFFNDKLLYNIGDKFRYPSIYQMTVSDANLSGFDWESVEWTITDAKENITKLKSDTGLSIVLNDDYSLDVE